jgi:hypothetical protein
MSKSPLLVQGMHGMGDNIHQRAVLRALMPNHSIWLETSWPCIYHDLVGPDLRLLRRPVALRTQLKNATREADKFERGGPLPHHRVPMVHMTYGRNSVRPGGSILEAMFQKAGVGAAYKDFDFSLPIPDEWNSILDHIVDDDHILNPVPPHRPIMVYRPLVARPEWRGSIVRNANEDDYAAVFASIRDHFFVVSVADLEPMREWIVGPQLKADLTLHKGELSFEALAALFKRAACVYTSSGFGAVLAPAVGTPCISIQGGFEPKSWHADGAKLAPFLGIDPINPCACATSACTNPCTKKLNMDFALGAVEGFLSNLGLLSPDVEKRPMTEMFAPAEHIGQIRQPPHTLRQAVIRPGHPSLLAQRQIIRRPGGYARESRDGHSHFKQ